MRKIYNLLLALTAVVMLNSCEEEDWNPNDLLKESGSLSLSSMVVDVDDSETIVSRASVDVSTFEVTIVKAATQEVVSTWTYSDIPEIVTLEVGDYEIEVRSHTPEAAAWDAPYYYASKAFKIEKDEVIEIGTLTCVLSNLKVSVAYSEALFAALGDDVKVKIKVGDAGELEYVKGEQRAGYFVLPEQSSTLVATFEGTVDGRATSFYKTFTDIAVGQHHIITFSLNSGTIDPDIIIDADISYDDIVVDVPGDDDVLPDDRPGESEDNAPTITSETLNIDGVNEITESLVAKVDIAAPLGVSNFEVVIISEQLTKEELQNVGLDSEFDLAYPGELEGPLTELGFPTGDAVIGQTNLTFDITMFMSLLVYFPGTHQFQLTITDMAGQSITKTLTFHASEL